LIVDLAVDVLESAHPERTITFLHGILGRGNNLRTIARQFIQARPDWTAWLVDLRGHGRSPKRTSGSSLEAVARDVVKLASRALTPLRAIVGHSFGGKVALEAAAIGGIASLEHVVVIDSAPGVREPHWDNDSPLAVLDMIESLPRSFVSKTAFIEAVIAKGKTRELAQWLAQSVERKNDEMRFILDLEEIRALILDYLSRDMWPVVEHPPGAVNVHLVIADRSSAYTAADRKQAQQIADSNARVTVDVLPAGHWVHVDDPDGLLQVLLDRVSPEVNS
jgi:esterase